MATIISSDGSSTATSTPADEVRKANLKMQKQTYRTEKKKAAAELVSALKDPTVVVMADWLKIRGTLRKWMRFYCVLKPGMLLIYKSEKTHKYGYWVGTVLLSSCELIERPSKKEGFCFKLYRPLDQSIWATRGPRGESFGAVTMPLPSSYLICRAETTESGRCWMDALELALRCSGLLIKTMHKLNDNSANSQSGSLQNSARSGDAIESVGSSSALLEKTAQLVNDEALLERLTEFKKQHLDDTDAEQHFRFDDQQADESTRASEEDDGVSEDEHHHAVEEQQLETIYTESAPEVFGALGDSQQTEEVAEENKSLLWTLMKQVRPGMDLSKVVLPTFILEPRSFLEKLADYDYHCDILGEAARHREPLDRMKAVVKFYLSGFYKKPKGLKKPYNPIIGEVFRCYWLHPDDDSRTYYIAEQVSHHPPVSTFYLSNRKKGYNVSSTILAKSKFYGNSLSALLLGDVRITLLERGEDYLVTLPYAYCKGLMLGTLTMEMGGQITIKCERTSYSCELEFKLKPFFGGSSNEILGKVKLGAETIASVTGHWDGDIYWNEKDGGKKLLLWQPSQDNIKKRLKRFEVPIDEQGEHDSQRLWQHVTAAIEAQDQVRATEEKAKLEDAQRDYHKEMKTKSFAHVPKHFVYDDNIDGYVYKYQDYRPWDEHNDVRQVESQYRIYTVTRHKVQNIRSTSRVNVSVPIKHSQSRDSWIDEDDEMHSPMRPVDARVSAPIYQLANQTNELSTELNKTEDMLRGVQRRLDRIEQSISQQGTSRMIYPMMALVLVLFILQAIILPILFRRQLAAYFDKNAFPPHDTTRTEL